MDPTPDPATSSQEHAPHEPGGFLSDPATDQQPEPAGSTPEPTPSIAPEALYPTVMKCGDMFDAAFRCQTMVGQFTNVYRYGKMRECKPHWRGFMYCMRNKSYGREARQQRVWEYYKSRDQKYVTGPSSEDVWEMRLKPLPDVFREEPPEGETG
ncbi:MAG: hypothetical protein M1826_003953 [Phylliscum demangeonii]|nr:MAG: hypothetical protein M1826_003953 [Phylliscum demangeonii]